MARFALLAAAWLSCVPFVAALDFTPPEKITDGSRKYGISRVSNGIMDFDSSGTLHACYWSGGLETNLENPSYVYYRNWNAASGWSAEEAIDDSESDGQHIGGRHPSLALTADGGVWVAWHDHRHGIAGQGSNFINNLEIYADHRPPEGSFSSSDLRLTDATDNGYVPRLAATPGSDSLTLAWHDFHFDSEISDIFLRRWDAGAGLPAGEGMSDWRLTSAPSRGGDPPAFNVADLAVASSGAVHLVWNVGFSPLDTDYGDLYYAELAPGASMASVERVGADANSFFFPAHLTLAPDGDLWLIYGDNSSGKENVVLRRRAAGATAFEAPIAVTHANVRQYAPDAEVDAEGIVHLCWVDKRGGEQHIYYGQVEAATGALLLEMPVTLSDGPWTRPSLALDDAGLAYILYEESSSLTSGDIWFVRQSRPDSSVRPDHWQSYR